MSEQEPNSTPTKGADWASLAREVLALNVWSGAFGFEVTVAESDRVVLRSSGDGPLCRQATGQWVGEAIELLSSLAAGTLPTSPGEQAGTFVAPYGATVRTIYHLRPSSSDWVEAEARWVRRGRSQAVIETTVRDSDGRELVRVLSQHAAIPDPLVFTLEDLRRGRAAQEERV